MLCLTFGFFGALFSDYDDYYYCEDNDGYGCYLSTYNTSLICACEERKRSVS